MSKSGEIWLCRVGAQAEAVAVAVARAVGRYITLDSRRLYLRGILFLSSRAGLANFGAVSVCSFIILACTLRLSAVHRSLASRTKLRPGN
jgi:hypothetical protein